MKTCTNCGAQLNDEAMFCTQCGKNIEAEAAQGVPPVQDQNQQYQQYQQQYDQNQYQQQYQQNQYQQQYQPKVDIYDHTAEFDPKDISDNKVYCMLVYLASWLGIIVALLASGASKSEYVNFHVRQALKISVISTLSLIVMVTSKK